MEPTEDRDPEFNVLRTPSVACQPARLAACVLYATAALLPLEPSSWIDHLPSGKARKTKKPLFPGALLNILAERVGFEPTEGLTLRRFSRPVP